jgi:hypothetical protein
MTVYQLATVFSAAGLAYCTALAYRFRKMSASSYYRREIIVPFCLLPAYRARPVCQLPRSATVALPTRVISFRAGSLIMTTSNSH